MTGVQTCALPIFLKITAGGFAVKLIDIASLVSMSGYTMQQAVNAFTKDDSLIAKGIWTGQISDRKNIEKLLPTIINIKPRFSKNSGRCYDHSKKNLFDTAVKYYENQWTGEYGFRQIPIWDLPTLAWIKKVLTREKLDWFEYYSKLYKVPVEFPIIMYLRELGFQAPKPIYRIGSKNMMLSGIWHLKEYQKHTHGPYLDFCLKVLDIIFKYTPLNRNDLKYSDKVVKILTGLILGTSCTLGMHVRSRDLSESEWGVIGKHDLWKDSVKRGRVPAPNRLPKSMAEQIVNGLLIFNDDLVIEAGTKMLRDKYHLNIQNGRVGIRETFPESIFYHPKLAYDYYIPELKNLWGPAVGYSAFVDFQKSNILVNGNTHPGTQAHFNLFTLLPHILDYIRNRVNSTSVFSYNKLSNGYIIKVPKRKRVDIEFESFSYCLLRAKIVGISTLGDLDIIEKYARQYNSFKNPEDNYLAQSAINSLKDIVTNNKYNKPKFKEIKNKATKIFDLCI